MQESHQLCLFTVAAILLLLLYTTAVVQQYIHDVTPPERESLQVTTTQCHGIKISIVPPPPLFYLSNSTLVNRAAKSCSIESWVEFFCLLTRCEFWHYCIIIGWVGHIVLYVISFACMLFTWLTYHIYRVILLHWYHRLKGIELQFYFFKRSTFL